MGAPIASLVNQDRVSILQHVTMEKQLTGCQYSRLRAVECIFDKGMNADLQLFPLRIFVPVLLFWRSGGL